MTANTILILILEIIEILYNGTFTKKCQHIIK